MTVLATYAYLFANLAMLAVLLPALLWTRRRERSRLALAHEEAYWRPVRLGGGAIDVEDQVFTSVAGALVQLCAEGRIVICPGVPIGRGWAVA